MVTTYGEQCIKGNKELWQHNSFDPNIDIKDVIRRVLFYFSSIRSFRLIHCGVSPRTYTETLTNALQLTLHTRYPEALAAP